MAISISVVIDDLDVCWAVICPDKADTPLVIDANAVLSSSVSFESFQPVTRRGSQKAKRVGAIEQLQLALGDSPHVRESKSAMPFV